MAGRNYTSFRLG